MGIVGIDIDGVIAPNPWKNWHWPFFGRNPIRNRPIRALLASPYYVFRRPYPEAIEWIKNQQETGNEVEIVSGIYDFCGWLVLAWLKLWRIPFDSIYFRKNRHVSQPFFKAERVYQTGCMTFIDDSPDVILAIALRYHEEGFCGIHISQHRLGYVVSIRDTNNSIRGC